MFKGFYNLTSGMLTQGRNLNVIANNMTNVATAGFKADRYLASTFGDAVWSRVGNKSKVYAEVGRQSYILTSSELYTDFTQGSFEESGLPLDFAIEGEGYFAVETGDGGRAYTRGGNFSLDEEGYLTLPGQGRVLDPDGQTIQLVSDRITADSAGNLFAEGGGYFGTLGVFTFPEDAELAKNAQGLFTTAAEATAAQPVIRQGMLEHSNGDMIQQMVQMMSCQRAYQSAAQVTKMYDQLMSKAVTDLGRL